MSADQSGAEIEIPQTRLLSPVADGTPPEKVEKPAPRVFRIESSRTLRLPDRNLTIRRVAPPAEYRLQPEAQTTVDRQPEDDGSDITSTELLHISATVHRSSLTRVNGWTQDGQEFSAWTDIDFNNFSGFSSFVHKGRQYGLIMGIGNEENFPADAKFPPTRDSFLLENQSARNPQANEIAEAFTALFKTEGKDLDAARRGREAAAKKAAAEPPRPPEDITISIWDKPSRPLTPAEKTTRDCKKEAIR